MTPSEIQRLRDGEQLTVRVEPIALGRMGRPDSLTGTFTAASVTDAGYVQCLYRGRDYGPTLHYTDLEVV